MRVAVLMMMGVFMLMRVFMFMFMVMFMVMVVVMDVHMDMGVLMVMAVLTAFVRMIMPLLQMNVKIHRVDPALAGAAEMEMISLHMKALKSFFKDFPVCAEIQKSGDRHVSADP